VVYGWFMRRFKQLIEDGQIERMPDTVLYMVNMNTSAMRGAAADIIMYRNTPIPIAYTHLLEVFVKLYVLTAPVALVPLLLWMAPPVAMLVTFFFYGFLTLGRQMFNPFKDEPDSFPMAVMVDETIDNMIEMVKWIPAGVPNRPSKRLVLDTRTPSPTQPAPASTVPCTPLDLQDLPSEYNFVDDDSNMEMAMAEAMEQCDSSDDDKMPGGEAVAVQEPQQKLPAGAARGKTIDSLRQRPANENRRSIEESQEWRRQSLTDMSAE